MLTTPINTCTLELTVQTDVAIRPAGRGRVAGFAGVQQDGSQAYPHESQYQVDTWRQGDFDDLLALRPGDVVLVQGRIRVDTWTDRSSQERRSATKIECVAVRLMCRTTDAPPVIGVQPWRQVAEVGDRRSGSIEDYPSPMSH
jgi:hypothetical protein